MKNNVTLTEDGAIWTEIYLDHKTHDQVDMTQTRAIVKSFAFFIHNVMFFGRIAGIKFEINSIRSFSLEIITKDIHIDDCAKMAKSMARIIDSVLGGRCERDF